jgi:hypothetical protein
LLQLLLELEALAQRHQESEAHQKALPKKKMGQLELLVIAVVHHYLENHQKSQPDFNTWAELQRRPAHAKPDFNRLSGPKNGT